MYQFELYKKADQVGTYWYHSHMGAQRMDGIFGAIIISRKTDKEMPQISLVMFDWFQTNVIDIMVSRNLFKGP